MTNLVSVAQLSVVEARPWSQLLQWIDKNSVPIDLSGWTSSFVVSDGRDGPIMATSTPVLLTPGSILLSLNASQTSAIWAPKKRLLTWQLTLNSPGGVADQVWQGNLVVNPVVK